MTTKLDYQQVIKDVYDEGANALRTTGGGGGSSDVTIVADDVGLAKESTLSSLNSKVTEVDTSNVTVTSSALPTGAATEATLSSLNGKVVAVNTGAVTVTASALPTGAATETTLSSIDIDTGNIATSVQLLDDTVGTDTVLAPTKGLVIGGHSSGAGTQYNIVHVSNGGSMKVDNSGQTQPISAASLPLPTGAATEATLTSLNGKVTAVNTGAVVVASSALPTNAASETTLAAINTKTPALIGGAVPVTGSVTPVKQDVVDFFDVPVLDASSTNIPGSAGNPVEVVASLAVAATGIKINDTIGEFVGVYTGAALSEVLQCIVGPGEDGMIPVAMAAGERVSLRNMGSATLNNGQLCIQFLG